MVFLALAAGGCNGKGASQGSSEPPVTPPPPPPPPPPPLKSGDWTYYDTGQGLSGDVQDVSADEGGNVYVAGGDALYVKTRTAERFLRFDAKNAGLSQTCIDDAYSQCGIPGYASCDTIQPPPRFFQCRIQAVAGAEPGKAILGFDGYGDELQAYTDWGVRTGGADVVRFDPAAGTLSRERHVFLASPPHTICTAPGSEERVPPGGTCAKQDGWWLAGRPLFRKIHRIAVNHDPNSPKYGDAWFCGEHSTFSALFNNAAARNYFDRTAGYPAFADAKDAWDHAHPSLHDETNPFINAPCWGLSIGPDGTPWGSNQYRTAQLLYPAWDLSNDAFGLAPIVTPPCPTGATSCPRPYAGYDLWPDPPDAELQSGEYYWPNWNFDGVHSLSHCPDGTVWVGSFTHGLARIDPGGAVQTDVGVTAPVLTVACDPLDASVWIGFQGGGVGRLRNGVLERVDTTGLPAFANHEVQSIQIDRWVGDGRRVVYFAFTQTTDASGTPAAGGVASYEGP